LKDSPVGFSAIENDSVVGFVGVMDVATRTLDGEMAHVGGVYGVATMPSHVRKGISAALMNTAHQHFRDKGYRFSFLGTSHTIIAHSFYKKLGYTDLLEIPSAYKVLRAKTARPSVKEGTAKLDFDRIMKIYNAYVEGRTGLVVRNQAYLNMLKKSERLTDKQCIVDEEGYVLFRKERGNVWVRELLALNAEEIGRLISLVEEEAKDLIYDRAVFDSTLLQAYKSHGYMIQERSHSVIMVKPLKANASFKQTYGSKFYLTGLDSF
jgi:ribosomal protein S18 acetylase RimI-like enzyme